MKMPKIIKKEDYFEYLKTNSNKRIEDIFANILDELPVNLRQEAITKGLKLIEVDRHLDLINLRIIVQGASETLIDRLSLLDPFIICE